RERPVRPPSAAGGHNLRGSPSRLTTQNPRRLWEGGRGFIPAGSLRGSSEPVAGARYPGPFLSHRDCQQELEPDRRVWTGPWTKVRTTDPPLAPMSIGMAAPLPL